MRTLTLTVFVIAAALAGCKKGSDADKQRPTGGSDTMAGSDTTAGSDTMAGSATGKGSDTMAGSDTGKGSDTMAGSAKSGDITAGWIEHKAPEGYTVKGPTENKPQETTVPTAIGDLKGTIYMYSEDSSPGAMMVMVMKIPDNIMKSADIKKMLNDTRDGVIKTGGKLISDNKVTVNGVDGLDVLWGGDHPQMGPFKGRMRLFVHKNQLYQVQTIRAATADEYGKQGDAFVESFAFVE